MTYGPVGGNLRVAVVGVGKMGQNHARCLSSMKGVDLVAVVDADPTLRQSVAESSGSRPVESIDGLQEVDAAVVAVPTAHHAETGCALMERGIHCLVEKPLANDPDDARLLLEAADVAGVVLQVGHVERFNPAVRQLREVLVDEKVLAVNARRMSATSGRVTDIDVVMDLMVHDIDVVLSLMGDDTPSVVARGVDGVSGHDHVTALFSFDDQRMASLTASGVGWRVMLETRRRSVTRSTSISDRCSCVAANRWSRNWSISSGRFAVITRARWMVVRPCGLSSWCGKCRTGFARVRLHDR